VLLELGLTPDDVLTSGRTSVTLYEVLHALCLVRLSTKCFRLEEEAGMVETVHKQYHLNHAARVVQCQARAWLAIRHAEGPLPRAAVAAAAMLQLHAVIRTQRVTAEHVVCEQLGQLQRLLNRKEDQHTAKELVLKNRDMRKQFMAEAMAENRTDGKKIQKKNVKLNSLGKMGSRAGTSSPTSTDAMRDTFTPGSNR
jgi:hypothetical protein